MKWASAIVEPDSTKDSLLALVDDCCKQLNQKLDYRTPDLLFCFASPQFAPHYQELPARIKKNLSPKTLIGCSAAGLIGDGKEIEQAGTISLTAAIMPDVDIGTFHLEDSDLPDLDAGPDKWAEMLGIKENKPISCFILLPDPFSFRIDLLIQGLDFAFPQATKLGGLASGAHQVGVNALFLDGEIHRSGIAGVTLSGNLQVDTIVAQGCRPIGYPLRITGCAKNFLVGLDGKPAVHALYEVLQTIPAEDQKLAQESLFLGIVMDEFKEHHKPGDFLIRNILGLDERSGALLIGELLRNERTVQFHVRDADTSAEDLCGLLSDYKNNQLATASGALLFSCLGRGIHLYGIANHDSDCFRKYLGEIPLGGFFCNGEIGQVAGTTFLHGYTSSFGIFRSGVS